MKMKKLLLTLGCLAAMTCVAEATDTQTVPDARQWTLSRSWSNGFDALPDVSTDLEEFRSQYERNREQWDAMFEGLAANDLTALPAGKHPIEGSNLTVSIQDSKNEPLEKRKTESHRDHIDFQYVVKGTEGFVLLDHESSTPSGDYKPDVQRYTYDVSKAMKFNSTPGRFILFFPSDWHIAKVATGGQSEEIRVVVVKLDYVH